MKVYKITHDGSSYMADDLAIAAHELEWMDIGDEVKIEAVEMTKEQYEALEEFDGF